MDDGGFKAEVLPMTAGVASIWASDGTMHGSLDVVGTVEVDADGCHGRCIGC